MTTTTPTPSKHATEIFVDVIPTCTENPKRAQDQIMLTDNAVEHITDFGDGASTRPTPRRGMFVPCQQTRACQASRASSPAGIASTHCNTTPTGAAFFFTHCHH